MITSRLMRLFQPGDPGWEESDSVVPNADDDRGDLDLSSAVDHLRGIRREGEPNTSRPIVGRNTVQLYNSLISGEQEWDTQDELDRGGRYDRRDPPST
jgi:hypothetical protein